MPEFGVGGDAAVVAIVPEGLEGQADPRGVIRERGGGGQDHIISATEKFRANGQKRKDVAMRADGDEVYSHSTVHIR